MPSKRTNDSVDRILEELSHEQAERGIRDSVTDRQVDAILKESFPQELLNLNHIIPKASAVTSHKPNI